MTRKRRARKPGTGWFHAVLVALRTWANAMRGREPAPTKPRKAPPFCTVCGERTRPYDPDDPARHQHDRTTA